MGISNTSLKLNHHSRVYAVYQQNDSQNTLKQTTLNHEQAFSHLLQVVAMSLV